MLVFPYLFQCFSDNYILTNPGLNELFILLLSGTAVSLTPSISGAGCRLTKLKKNNQRPQPT